MPHEGKPPKHLMFVGHGCGEPREFDGELRCPTLTYAPSLLALPYILILALIFFVTMVHILELADEPSATA